MELLEQGVPVAEVARVLQMTARSVRRWQNLCRERGPNALTARPVPGRPSKLTKHQRRHLVTLVRRHDPKRLYPGGRAYWSGSNLARLIETHFGVRYHPGHLCFQRLLRLLGIPPNELSSLLSPGRQQIKLDVKRQVLTLARLGWPVRRIVAATGAWPWMVIEYLAAARVPIPIDYRVTARLPLGPRGRPQHRRRTPKGRDDIPSL